MITAVILFYSNCYYTAVVGCSYYCYSKYLLCGGLLDAWGGMCAWVRLCKAPICFICNIISFLYVFFSDPYVFCMFSFSISYVFYMFFSTVHMLFSETHMFLSMVHIFFSMIHMFFSEIHMLFSTIHMFL